MNDITEYSADGWPLCPCCGEDELWSALNWNGDGECPPLDDWIAAGLRCYLCNWHAEKVPNIAPKDTPQST